MSAPITYWHDQKDGKWLGYWNDFPDYPTEGYTLDDLKGMLIEIRGLINDRTLPSNGKREIATLEFA